MSYCSSDTTEATSSMAYTPRGDSSAIGDLSLRDNPSDAAPWPGNTYIIQHRDSKQSITPCNGIPVCKASSTDRSTHWLCVESGGYFGFLNKKQNIYLSFQNGIIQAASDFGSRELFLPIRHPRGGYILMVPYGSDKLKQVAILSGSTALIARQHGGSIWELVQVSESD